MRERERREGARLLHVDVCGDVVNMRTSIGPRGSRPLRVVNHDKHNSSSNSKGATNTTMKLQLKHHFHPPPTPNPVGICKNFTNRSCRAIRVLQLWLKDQSLIWYGWRDIKLQRRVPQNWIL
jgi:hypothetical protein